MGNGDGDGDGSGTGNGNENGNGEGARRHVPTDCSVLCCCHFVFGFF